MIKKNLQGFFFFRNVSKDWTKTRTLWKFIFGFYPIIRNFSKYSPGHLSRIFSWDNFKNCIRIFCSLIFLKNFFWKRNPSENPPAISWEFMNLLKNLSKDFYKTTGEILKKNFLWEFLHESIKKFLKKCLKEFPKQCLYAC